MMNFDLNNKSERVLAASLSCFKQYGFKRTSMEDLAKAADMSRPALYLLFKNKTDIFRSLSEAFHTKILLSAEQALAENTSIQTRISTAVVARMAPLYALAHESTHGPELFDVNQSTAGDINAKADDTFLQLITDALQSGISEGKITGGPDNLAARELAQLILANAIGLKTFTFSAKDYETLLAKSIGTFFQGMMPK
jgi:AcrR family transcriptional regulator